MTMQATKQAARRAPCARLRAQAQALAVDMVVRRIENL